ncbi:MAG: fibronectin type III domain-containing protein [bacterium]|nr:fibronectin type III domain-containing protein [bacterium]
MKQLVLFFSALFLSVGTSFGQCPNPEVAPWSDNVESLNTTTGVISQNCWSETSPTGYDWNIDGAGSTPSPGTGPLGANSGSRYFYTEASGAAVGVEATLFTPQVDVSALTVPMLTFAYHMTGAQMGTLNVEYSDNGGASWNLLTSIVGEQQLAQGDPWLISELIIPATGVIDIRFRAVSAGSFEGDICLDDIGVVEAPTCPTPTNLSVTNIQSTQVDLSWTDNAGASEWQIEYGPAGFTQGTGTFVTVNNTTPTLTGLTPSTSYDLCVRAVCSPGDSSDWLCANTFATACATYPTPFIESFATSGVPLCWTQGGQTNWEYGSSATTPTGPAGWGATGTPDYSTPPNGTFLMMDGSDNTTGEVSTYTSPLIDASTLTLPMMSYAVFSNNTNDPTNNILLVEFWDGSAWNTINTIQQNLGPNWVLMEHIIDPVTITGDVQMRFTVTGGAGTTFYNDILLDDIELKEAPSCPSPTALAFTGGDNTSAGLSWNAGWQETSWILEYGPTGFTPGSGTQVVAPQNPDTLTGLAPDQFYEVYVYADCGGDTSAAVGPVLINTFNQGEYMEWDSDCPLGGFVDISATGVLYDLPDDGEVGIDPLPFTILFQNEPVTNMSVGNNGGMQLGNPNQTTIGYGGNFNTLADGFMFPWGDDLDSETGDIFIQQVGTSPNSVLVIQWNNSNNFSNGQGTVTFQVQIEESTNEIYYVYDDVIFGGNESGDDYAANADIGISGPNQDYTVSTNDPTYLQDNSCVHFYYTNCPRPQNYSVTYTTTSEGAITWNAGLANETEWQVIYGPQGFDPQTNGTSVTVNTGSALVIPGLDDMTTYDVYIMALCANGDTSVALTGDFTTLPNCADPTGLAGATAVDSIFTAWNYTANSGFPIQEFAFEYGPTGYMNGMGTQVYGIDTINTTDTLVDAGLMSGGLYDVYIQAVCNTGDSSNWVGPITVTMPLTNDSTCLAQAIPVDGVNYSFNGTGATVAAGEAAIAPPAGPCDGQMTWCNSSVTASTWYTFIAPASGNVRIDGEFQNFDGQVAVYETTDCNDFNQYNLIGANDDFNTSGDDFVYLNLCGLTPGNTYYMMHDPNGAAGVYSLRVQDITVEAGTDNGQLDVCLGDIVDLSTQLTGADAGGTWSEDIPTAGFNDPIWSSAGLASQVYTFEYMVVDGCAADSVETTIQVWAPSFAGNDGTIDACMNEPVDLLQGLVGGVGVSFTGTWYDPSANALPSSDIYANSIPGQYNYQYIAGNGICEDDTATVTVIVDPNCNYLNLQDLTFNGMDIYPNPTTNVFYISNEGSTEVFNYELTDLNGKVITTKEAAITGVETTEVNVEKLETGVYLIRIFNETAEKTFRVIKQ